MAGTERQLNELTGPALLARAEELMPSAGIGAYALPEELRFVFAEGQGARLRDVDGREYVDYVGGAGALILGHSHPAVVAAVNRRSQRGQHIFGVLNDGAIALAERLVEAIPSAEKILYATTGSEATAFAFRLARAATGRELILKFEGAYHGNHDYALVSTFPRERASYPRGAADTSGQPQAVRDSMLVAPYNDIATTGKIFEQYGSQIAAVIVEPVQRIIAADPHFLVQLRQLCTDQGALLIFDEIVTGFRIAYGGAQTQHAVMPDLSTFGKIIGGGGPLAVVAGRADIIDLGDPRRRGQDRFTYFSGTLHGNPLAAAATLATLDELSQPGFYRGLEAYTQKFCDQCNSVLTDRGVPAIVCSVGSLWQILFIKEPPRSYADIMAGDTAAMQALDRELLRRNQYVLPGMRRFISKAHGQRELDEFLPALDASCRAL